MHPSIYQPGPDSTRTSAAYAFISTANVLERITELTGWRPVRVISQARGAVATGKHVVLLERDGAGPGDRNQIALLNSHNGTSSFRLLLARHVAVCSNGIFMPVGTLSDFRIRHVGKNVAETVATAIERLATHIPETERLVERLKLTPFSAHDEVALATHAAKTLRGHDLVALNATRRPGQDAANLWDAFNRVQERIIRGGYQHLVALEPSAVLSTKTARRVTSPAELVRLNTALWETATALVK